MSENNSFKVEGLELRVRQKPITETVIQSNARDLSLRISPRIFINEQGKMLFQDNIQKDPVSLKSMENFYERIRYVDGELRFFSQKSDSYVNLSQMVSKDDLLINTNSMLYSSRTLWEPDETFSALTEIENTYKESFDIINVGISITEAISARGIFWDTFIGEQLRWNEDDSTDTIFDTFVNRFVSGVRGYLADLPLNFCDDEDCTLQNKKFWINDEKIGLSRLPNDPLGKIYLFDENLQELDFYLFSNFYKYNGIGKFLHKVFNNKVATTTEVYDNYFFEEDGWTTKIQTQENISGTFNLLGDQNVQCGDLIPHIGSNNIGGYSLGKIEKGWLAIKVINDNLTIAPGVSGEFPYLGCSNTHKIGTIECPFGEFSRDGNYTIVELTEDSDDLKVWLSDYDDSDNSGSADLSYLYRARYFDLTGEVTISSITNAVFEDDDGNLIEGKIADDPIRFVADTSTVKLGIFPAGTLTFNLNTGGVRFSQDSSVFFNETLSGGTGELRTNIGGLQYNYGVDQEIEITNESAPILVEMWYQDDDNFNNEGTVTYTYSFTPAEPLLTIPPPAIPGQGIFYNTDLYPYQNIALEEISRAFSSRIFERFVLEMHQILEINGYISGGPEISLSSSSSSSIDDIYVYKFLSEAYYNNVLTEDILEQTKQRFINKKTIIQNELYNAFEAVFDDNTTSYFNLDDYSTYTVGGQFTPEQIYDIDFSLYNGVWFDLNNFYQTTPKISNDTGVSVFASLNIDIKHASNLRYEFRIFETVTQTEMDKAIIETFDFDASKTIGNILKDREETYPIQLQYIGPVPPVQCTEDTFNKCVASSELDINSHIKINSSDLYSSNAVHSGFKVITDRLNNLDISATSKNNFDSSAGGTNIINLDSPRIFRIQWRLVIDKDVAVTPHKLKISDMTFNKNTPRSDNFEISTNIYDLGNISNNKLMTQGIVIFENEKNRRITVPSLVSSKTANYSITLIASKNIKVWYEDKTGSGFTIVAEKAFTGEISWVVNKQAGQKASDTNNKIDANELPTCLVDYKPAYGSRSNFEIFKEEGYQVDIVSEEQNIAVTETISGAPISSELNTEEIIVDKTYYLDTNGPNCSTECYNDCPDDWFCSSLCPNAEITQSGCACCECIENNDCPSGYLCNEFGECVPGI